MQNDQKIISTASKHLNNQQQDKLNEDSFIIFKEKNLEDKLLNEDDSSNIKTPSTRSDKIQKKYQKLKLEKYNRIFSIDISIKSLPIQVWAMLQQILPVSLSAFFQFFFLITNMYFVKRLNNSQKTAAYGLGQSWFNLSGYALLITYFSGLLNKASYAHGARQYDLVGIYYQISQFIGVFLILVSIVLQILSYKIFIFFNINYQVAKDAQEYCIFAIPSLLSTLLFDSTRYYLYSQNERTIPLICQLIAMIFHPLWSYLFILRWGFGIKGTAFARIISFTFQYILILIFIYANIQKYKKTWIPFTKKAFKGWGNFLLFSINTGASDYLKWFAGELITVLVGLLNNDDILAAQVTLQSITMFFWMFKLASVIVTNSTLSQAIGAGNENLSKNIIKITIIFSSLLTIVISLLALVTKYFWIFLLGGTPETIKYFKIIYVFFLSFYLQGEYFQAFLTALLRALHKQLTTTMVFIICYFFIGIPTGCILAFLAKLSIKGLWIGFCLAPTLNSIVLFVILSKVKVNQCIQQTQLHIHQDKSNYNINK